MQTSYNTYQYILKVATTNATPTTGNKLNHPQGYISPENDWIRRLGETFSNPQLHQSTNSVKTEPAPARFNYGFSSNGNFLSKEQLPPFYRHYSTVSVGPSIGEPVADQMMRQGQNPLLRLAERASLDPSDSNYASPEEVQERVRPYYENYNGENARGYRGSSTYTESPVYADMKFNFGPKPSESEIAYTPRVLKQPTYYEGLPVWYRADPMGTPSNVRFYNAMPDWMKPYRVSGAPTQSSPLGDAVSFQETYLKRKGPYNEGASSDTYYDWD